MLDRSSDLSNLMKKMNGGTMAGNIKKVQVIQKTTDKGKSPIKTKKCNSCSRKKKK